MRGMDGVGPQRMLERAAEALHQRIDGAALFYARGEVNKRVLRDATWGSTVLAPAPHGPIAMVVAVTPTAVHVLGSNGPSHPLFPMTELPVESYRASSRRHLVVIELTLVPAAGPALSMETKRWGANRKNPAVVRLILERARVAAQKHQA
jgi:hypothetical protein